MYRKDIPYGTICSWHGIGETVYHHYKRTIVIDYGGGAKLYSPYVASDWQDGGWEVVRQATAREVRRHKKRTTHNERLHHQTTYVP